MWKETKFAFPAAMAKSHVAEYGNCWSVVINP